MKYLEQKPNNNYIMVFIIINYLIRPSFYQNHCSKRDINKEKESNGSEGVEFWREGG